MAVWQWHDQWYGWCDTDSRDAAYRFSRGYQVRLITDPATLRDCWHCGFVTEAGLVDERGREWCGCKQNERSLT